MTARVLAAFLLVAGAQPLPLILDTERLDHTERKRKIGAAVDMYAPAGRDVHRDFRLDGDYPQYYPRKFPLTRGDCPMASSV